MVHDLSRSGAHVSELSGPASSKALAALLESAAAGYFPPADGSVEILAQPSDRDAGVISLTAFAVVFADTDPGWIAAQLPADDLAAPLSARFLHALGERLRREVGSVDMLACAGPLPGAPPLELMLAEIDPPQPGSVASEPHARIARALRYRDDVRAWQAAGGVLTLGRGVAGRWEVAIEVDPQSRGDGLGASARLRGQVPGPGRRAGVGPDRAGQRGQRPRIPAGRIPAGRRRGTD